jgi:hypothetical protein
VTADDSGPPDAVGNELELVMGLGYGPIRPPPRRAAEYADLVRTKLSAIGVTRHLQHGLARLAAGGLVVPPMRR